MQQSTTNEAENPAVGTTANERSVIGFPTGDDGQSPLDVLVREGAKKTLQATPESEVQDFLERHASRVDD